MSTINPLRNQSFTTETPKNESLKDRITRAHNKFKTAKTEYDEITDRYHPSFQTLWYNLDIAGQTIQDLGTELESNRNYYEIIRDCTLVPLLLSGFIYGVYIVDCVGRAALISTIVPEILIATAIFGSIVGFFVYTNNKYNLYKEAVDYRINLMMADKPKS